MRSSSNLNKIVDLSSAKLSFIYNTLKRELFNANVVSFLIIDPDICDGKYTGEELVIDEKRYICRSWRVWSDLAKKLKCRLMTPKVYDKTHLILTLKKLEKNQTFHSDSKSKYNTQSRFAKIKKSEEPYFYIPYIEALKRLKVDKKSTILDLGINRADELEAIFESGFKGNILGIDLCEDALNEAKMRFKDSLETLVIDLNDINRVAPQRFDLIVSIATLQSPSINLKPLIMHLVQERLNPQGSILLAWPNARWIDGELIYGAKPKNYPFSELSLVIKDLFWIKKYLQQHRFRVVITGKEYLFLEATKIIKKA